MVQQNHQGSTLTLGDLVRCQKLKVLRFPVEGGPGSGCGHCRDHEEDYHCIAAPPVSVMT